MKKKGLMRKRSLGFMAFVLLLTVIMTSFRFIGVAASGTPEEVVGPKEYNDVFSNIKVSKWGQNVENGAEVEAAQWNNFKIEADFTLPNNTVKANDISKISIPTSMFIMPITEIKDADGKVVAKVSINNRNQTGEDNTKEKELILTYTDYVEKHSEVKGKFFFEIRVDHTIELEKKKIPLVIQLGNHATYSFHIDYQGFGTPEEKVFDKSGWYVNDKTKTELEKQSVSTLEYRLQVNQKRNTINNAKIVDQLVSEKVFIRPETLKIRKGRWKAIMGSLQLRAGDNFEKVSQDVTDQFQVVYEEGNRGFTLDLGDIGAEDGYEITYYVETEYLAVNGEIFKNNATLTGEGIEEVRKESNITYAVGGGVAEGNNYKIKIVKKDEADATKVLQGAEFEVVRKRSGVVVGKLITEADGTAEVGNLLKDTYIIKETKAPEGYELKADEIEVDAATFDKATRMAEVVVTNKEAAPTAIILPQKEKISIPVTVVWVGGEEAKANVSVKVGSETKETKEFSKENGHWTGKFEELDKENDLGEKISYTVEQGAVVGYTTEIKKNEETDITKGFTITNTKVVIPYIGTFVGNDTTAVEDKTATVEDKSTPEGETISTEETKTRVETEPVKVIANHIPEMVEEREAEVREPEFYVMEAEIPEIPEESDEVGDEDLEIFGDETPRGNTEIEAGGVKSPKGKTMLAKTGGLKTYFIPAAAITVLLAAIFVGIEIHRKKNNKR